MNDDILSQIAQFKELIYRFGLEKSAEENEQRTISHWFKQDRGDLAAIAKNNAMGYLRNRNKLEQQINEQAGYFYNLNAPSKEIAIQLDTILDDWDIEQKKPKRTDQQRIVNRWFQNKASKNADDFLFMASHLELTDAIKIASQGVQQFPQDNRLRDQLRDLKCQIARNLKVAGKMDEAVTFLDNEIRESTIDEECLYTFLVETMKEKDIENCRVAIHFLQKREDKRAVIPISELFEQAQDPDLRVSALLALVDIQQKEALPQVWIALRDNRSSIRLCAAEIFGRIGDSSIVERLAQTLKSEKDVAVRKEMISTLRKLDDKPRTFGEKITGRRLWAR